MLQAKANSGPGRGSFAKPTPIILLRWRGASTATSGCPMPAQRRPTSAAKSWGSLRFVLSLKLSQNLLGFLYVVECELAGFDQMRHDRLSASPEQRQQVIDQFSLGGVAGERGLEDVKVTDLLDATNGLFPFQAINRGLDGGVSWSAFFGESFLDLADGGLALTPKSLHDLKFELCQFWFGHFRLYYKYMTHYYICMCCQVNSAIGFQNLEAGLRVSPDCRQRGFGETS